MPMTPVRWLHLSDFHVGKDNYGQRRMFSYILDNVNAKLQAGAIPDIIFLTGDIANKGKLKEYEEFFNEFFFPLTTMLGKGWKGKIYSIPGNHDVDRDQSEAIQRYGILEKLPTFLDPTEEGLSKRKQLLERFTGFVDNDFIYDGATHWLTSKEGYFTDTVTLHGYKIGILGVNTAWLSEGNNDLKQMTPGKNIIETGLEAIKDCSVRIVIGHHPLDWFAPKEEGAIRSRFGKNNVIYLHGHLHRSESRQEEGAGWLFRAIQAGACFQARDDEMWRNRILWVELDFEAKEILVEPLVWNPGHVEWKLDGDAFPERFRKPEAGRWHLPLPIATPVNHPATMHITMPKPSLPVGWQFIDEKYLNNQKTELSATDILRFFDGRVPTWKEALSPQIPRRTIVHEIVSELNQAHDKDETGVTLLLGAGGEGKSTVLRQVVCELVSSEPTWHIIWRNDPQTPLLLDEYMSFSSNGSWLIVSDDADLIATEIFEMLRALHSAGRKNTHFLLGCRDTDWMGAGGDALPWRRYAHLNPKRLRGLSFEDASLIVQAWGEYGDKGLGRLAGLERQDATMRLLNEARSEPGELEGAFLGAMLRARFGQNLQSHIQELLRRLESRHVPGGTLMRAFAYIAALHAENKLILTKDILAEALGIELGNLKRQILGPLGEEAAITPTSRFVLIRHRAIAEEAVRILSEVFHEDFDEIYADLVRASTRIFLSGGSVADIATWNYLSNYFFETGRVELGIRLARTLVESEPNNAHFVVQLSRLLRQDGQAERGARICEERAHKVVIDRAYYYEWGTAEGNIENHGLSVWLAGISLADGVRGGYPDNFRAKVSLAGLVIALEKLYDKYNNPTFIAACGAAAQLGSMLELDTRTASIIRNGQRRAEGLGIGVTTPSLALEQLQIGIITAWRQREQELPSWIQQGDELTFRGLASLLRINLDC